MKIIKKYFEAVYGGIKGLIYITYNSAIAIGAGILFIFIFLLKIFLFLGTFIVPIAICFIDHWYVPGTSIRITGWLMALMFIIFFECPAWYFYIKWMTVPDKEDKKIK